MPVIVAAGVVFKEDRVLLTRRTQDQHLGGLWEFPGGKLEEGESPDQAVVRECREECGIAVEVERILEVSYYRYPDRDVLLLFYRCRWVAGEVSHLEISDHAWARPSELGGYALPPADEPVLRRIVENDA